MEPSLSATAVDLSQRPELNGCAVRIGAFCWRTMRFACTTATCARPRQLAIKPGHLQPCASKSLPVKLELAECAWLLGWQIAHYLSDANLCICADTFTHAHLTEHDGELPLSFFALFKAVRALLDRGGVPAERADRRQALLRRAVGVFAPRALELCRGDSCVRRRCPPPSQPGGEGSSEEERIAPPPPLPPPPRSFTAALLPAGDGPPRLVALDSSLGYLHAAQRVVGGQSLSIHGLAFRGHQLRNGEMLCYPLTVAEGSADAGDADIGNMDASDPNVIDAGATRAGANDDGAAVAPLRRNTLASDLAGFSVHGDALIIAACARYSNSRQDDVSCALTLPRVEALLGERRGVMPYVLVRLGRPILGHRTQLPHLHVWPTLRADGGPGRPRAVLVEFLRAAHSVSGAQASARESPTARGRFAGSVNFQWPADEPLPPLARWRASQTHIEFADGESTYPYASQKEAMDGACLVALEALHALRPCAMPLSVICLDRIDDTQHEPTAHAAERARQGIAASAVVSEEAALSSTLLPLACQSVTPDEVSSAPVPSSETGLETMHAAERLLRLHALGTRLQLHYRVTMEPTRRIVSESGSTAAGAARPEAAVCAGGVEGDRGSTPALLETAELELCVGACMLDPLVEAAVREMGADSERSYRVHAHYHGVACTCVLALQVGKVQPPVTTPIPTHEMPPAGRETDSGSVSNAPRTSHGDLRMQYVIRQLLCHSPPSQVIVDVGCGECTLFRKMLHEGTLPATVRSVIGIDVDRSGKRLARAGRKLSQSLSSAAATAAAATVRCAIGDHRTADATNGAEACTTVSMESRSTDEARGLHNGDVGAGDSTSVASPAGGGGLPATAELWAGPFWHLPLIRHSGGAPLFGAGCTDVTLMLIEVIEHFEPSELDQVGPVLLGRCMPRRMVVTTPNREYNVHFVPQQPASTSHVQSTQPIDVDSLPLRNPDHKFEFTRAEFRAWATALAQRFGYDVTFDGIDGEASDALQVGPSTLVALFDQVCAPSDSLVQSASADGPSPPTPPIIAPMDERPMESEVEKDADTGHWSGGMQCEVDAYPRMVWEWRCGSVCAPDESVLR